MKHNILAMLLLFISLTTLAQSYPEIIWVNPILSGADSPSEIGLDVLDVAVSPEGSTYVAGYCTAPCAFAQGVAVVPEAGGQSLFIAKYRHDGLFEWVKDLGTIGTNPVHITAPELDGIYLATSFSVNSVSLGNGISVTRTCNGSFCDEALLAKFGPSGEAVWARTFSGGPEVLYKLSGIEQPAPGVILTYLNYSADELDLGPGFQFTNQPPYGYLLAFLNSNTGVTTAVKFPGNSSNGPLAKSLAYNQGGQGVMTGVFFNQIDFPNGTSLTTTDPNGAHFAAGLDVSANVQWGRKLSSSDYMEILAAEVDDIGGVYLAIDASTDLLLDDGSILSINSNYAGAVVKLDATGFSIPVFIPYNADDYAIMDVEVDHGGFIYTIGFTTESLQFGNNLIMMDGCEDGFFTQTNADGTPVIARTIGGGGCEGFSNYYYGSCMELDQAGYLYGAGGFSYIFNEDDFSFSGKGKFVTKLNTSIAGTNDPEYATLDLFPNPSSGTFRISLANVPGAGASLSLSNLHGQELIRQNISQKEVQFQTSLGPGIYLVSIQDGNRVYRGKIRVE
jgi:hypothetical protein